MPAIQVYKSGSTMIPVDSAKKTRAYICPWTGEIYATKRGYLSHLKNLRTERMHRNARKKVFRRKLETLWDQPDFTNVVNWIETNPDVFWQLGNDGGYGKQNWQKIRDDFGIKIKYLSLEYGERISNSHNCPHDGVTNWGGRDTLKDGSPAPRGYPGFSGTIAYQLTHEPPSFASDIMRGTRIHTGTGGGGSSQIYRYEVKFFLDDWPGIKQTVELERADFERKQMINALSRKAVQEFKKTFKHGEDPWNRR